MKNKQIDKTKVMYSVVRFVAALMFVLNVLALFFDKDDSQKSRDGFNAAQSFMMFVCTFVPGFVEKKGEVSIPNVMSVIFLVFCLAHFVVGEIGELYIKSKVFDSVLHMLSGSMLAILGFSIIRLLNDSEKDYMKLSPLFVAIFVVCFSVTLGVLWEVFEFGMDAVNGTNMQRYSDSVSRVDFSGRDALFDTMKDLILDLIGAIVVATVGYVDLKNDKELIRIRWFIVKNKKETVSEQTKNQRINIETENNNK